MKGAATATTNAKKKAKPKQKTKQTAPQASRAPARTGPPTLRFSPTAWAKLLYLRDRGGTEVGGFGIAAAEDHLRIEDLRLVRQHCAMSSVVFDDAAVADFFDEQVDLGRRPEQFARIWVHTHPANSAQPSATDEQTFSRCFDRADWAVMFILARGGETYARLRFNVGPGGSLLIPLEVDYQPPFPAADPEAWEAEYAANVVAEDAQLDPTVSWDEDYLLDPWRDDPFDEFLDFLEEDDHDQ
jgi:proteasome lid subunit RPN8/RPN11